MDDFGCFCSSRNSTSVTSYHICSHIFKSMTIVWLILVAEAPAADQVSSSTLSMWPQGPSLNLVAANAAAGSTWDQPRYSDWNMFSNAQNSSGFSEMSSGCAEFMFVVPRFCLGFDVPGLSAPGWWFPLWRGMVNIQQLVVSACSIFTRPWGQEGWLHFDYLLFIPTR